MNTTLSTHSSVDPDSTKLTEIQVILVDVDSTQWKLFTQDPAVTSAFSKFNPFYRRGASQCFIALDKDTGMVVGRIAAFVDAKAKPLSVSQPFSSVGSFGYFDCPPKNTSVACALLRAAEKWLTAESCTEVIGPIDFTIFHNYRVMSSGFDRPPYLGEPRTPPHFIELLQQCGYSSRSTWRTYDFSAADHLAQLETMKTVLAPLQQSLKPYEIVPISTAASDLEGELKALYPLIMESFSKNFAATELDMEEFIALYRPLVSVLCPASSFKVVHMGENVGFSIGYRNPLNPGTAVWHSFGNTAAHRGKGLGYLCIARVFEGFVQEGYKASYCSLVKDGPNHFEHTHAAGRSYEVFGRKLR
jgi:hypothetical protein